MGTQETVMKEYRVLICMMLISGLVSCGIIYWAVQTIKEILP